MCPSQLFSTFFLVSLLLLLFSIFINSSRADDMSFANCPSSICENGLNISYPFWRLDSYNSTSPQYCGYPGFGIHCFETDRILYISDDSFYVKEINYNNNSLTLVDIDALDTRGCLRAHHNLTLDEGLPFEYSKLDMNLNFYYNCISSLTDPAHTLDCLNSGGNKSYLYVEDYEPKDLNWYRTCEKKVAVPVMKSEWESGGKFGAAIQEGFVLDWKIAKECGKCEASDGRCGYNNSTHKSLCFCKDGTVNFDKCNNNNGTPLLRV